MRSKPKGGSILHGLTPEQREKVDGWLFDENNSYPKVAERCREELGVQLSRSSVGRYYERECVSRSLERMARHAVTKKRVLSAVEDAEEDYKIVVGIAGQLATAEALKPVEHTDLGKIGQATKLMIAARKEKHEEQRVLLQQQRVEQNGKRVALAQRRFQFDAAIECLRHQQAMKAIMDNDELNDPARVMAIRERLFGPDLPT